MCKIKYIIPVLLLIAGCNQARTTPTNKSGILQSKIVSGGPPPDGIPPVDDPQFSTMKQADRWLTDDELVLLIKYKGEYRIYPYQIMVWHEIVNDTIQQDPILITYCPLCGTGLAFIRQVDDIEVSFGTSGKLYNSNLLMYDRKTKSLWTQMEGEAVYGPLTGQILTRLSLDTLSWKEWKQKKINALVLNRNTGKQRDYGKDPYDGYYSSKNIYFPLEHYDQRLHPKEIVYGLNVNGTYKAYPYSKILKQQVINDKIGERNINIKILNDGRIKAFYRDTGQEILLQRGFWLVWSAFHVKSEIY